MYSSLGTGCGELQRRGLRCRRTERGLAVAAAHGQGAGRKTRACVRRRGLARVFGMFFLARECAQLLHPSLPPHLPLPPLPPRRISRPPLPSPCALGGEREMSALSTIPGLHGHNSSNRQREHCETISRAGKDATAAGAAGAARAAAPASPQLPATPRSEPPAFKRHVDWSLR